MMKFRWDTVSRGILRPSSSSVRTQPEKKARVECSETENGGKRPRLMPSLEPLNLALLVCSSLELPSYLFGLC